MALHSNDHSVTIADVLSHPEIRWDYELLSKNPNFSMTDVLETPEIFQYFVSKSEFKTINDDDIYLSNCKLELKDIDNHPEINWRWENLSRNPWIFRNLQTNKIKDVLNNPKYHWDWYTLSSNQGIKIKDIIENNDKPWNWGIISRNPILSIKDVLKNPTIGKMYKWEYWFLSENPNISNNDLFEYQRSID